MYERVSAQTNANRPAILEAEVRSACAGESVVDLRMGNEWRGLSIISGSEDAENACT